MDPGIFLSSFLSHDYNREFAQIKIVGLYIFTKKQIKKASELLDFFYLILYI
jgi:hypothetical protein